MWKYVIFFSTLIICLCAINMGLSAVGRDCFRTFQDRQKILGILLNAIIGLCGILVLTRLIYKTMQTGIENN
jgi:hypothetical protein